MTDAFPMDDPFGHLHDENYADAFDAPRLTHRQMVFMGGREEIPLDGEWNLTLDMFDEGLRQKWYLYGDEPVEEWEIPRDGDPWNGTPVTVPGCWNMVDPHWYHYEGGAWYSRIVDFPETPADERLFLRIGAAAYQARIFLNGQFLGTHTGASTPFFVELTGKTRPGKNLLLIQIDNRRRADRVPMHHFDWFNYGGIYREVSLVRTPATIIRDFAAYLVPDGTYSKILLRAETDGSAAGAVRFEIPELSIDITAELENGVAQTEVAAGPELWSTGNPRLYEVRASYGNDRVSDCVGFREIRVAGTDILLNGKAVFLRGISVHEDDVATGKVTSEEDIRRRFMHARELGCNFLRLSHYPHHEAAARLADEMGLLLWEEIPVYWAIDFVNSATFIDAENQLLELILRDRNRASVIIWSIGNENPDSDERLSFMSRLAEAARSADETRPIAAACLLDYKNLRIRDRLTEHLDIIGINEYYGWYTPNVADLIEIGANSNPGKPVVITETGAGARAGASSPQGSLFTEERMAGVYRQQLPILKRLDYLKGISPWILYDFRSERRQNPFQQGYNRKGLIAEDKKTKKMAFEVLAEFYRQLADEE